MAKTKEELEALKREYSRITSGLKELSDDELSQVTGGSYYSREYYKNENEVQFLFNIGDEVEVRNWFYIGTVRCKVVGRKKEYEFIENTGAPGMPGGAYYNEGWVDYYDCQELESHWWFPNGWYDRSMIEKK